MTLLAVDLVGTAAVVAACGTFLTGLAVLLTSIRQEHKLESAASKLATKTEETSEVAVKKLDEIHVLVNSRLTEALEKIESLEKRLEGVNPEEVGSE